MPRLLLRLLAFLAPGLSLLLASVSPASADDFFDVTRLPSSGRTVAADLADFDGDGRTDLFVGVLRGLPPDDERIALVYVQAEDGSFPTTPSFEKQLPAWSSVYDVEDVRPESPGHELVILLPDGVEIVSLAGPEAPSWKLPVTGPTTMGTAADERGLETFRIVHRHIGEEPWLLVPQIGQMTALGGDGVIKASIAQPRRSNFFIIPPTGLMSLESDFQVFLDSPKVLLGDIDGDGRNDIASATRHEIWVFLQKEDGGFLVEPDRKLALGMVTPRDHIRGSGGVASATGDIDGDGRIDLLVSHVKGGFSDSNTSIHVYLNRDGGWKIDAPDQTINKPGTISSNALVDMDRDGKVELVRLQFAFSLLEVIEIFISREIDLELSIHRYDGQSGFEEKPWVSRKISLPISFDTFRTKGFVPTARFDLNGDGFLDFTSSGDGDELVFSAGGRRGPFRAKAVRQKMSTAGMIDFADWSGDGLVDFVIFDPHNYDVPVQLGRNLGTLPGTPSGVRAAD